MKTKYIVLVLVVVVALAGVALLMNRRGGDPSLDAKVAEMIPKIEAATGLKFREPPVISTRSKEDVRAFLVAQLEDSATARELAGQELVLKRLGMMTEAQSLRSIYLDVLEEQIAGYYDPRTRVLYVVDGATPEMRDITVTHELVHALQDQYIALDSIQKIRGQDDRQIAAHAIMEGQATLEHMSIMFGNDIMSMIPGGWDGVRELIRDEQARMPKFAAAPIVVQEMLLFPYISGADFVRRYKENKPDGNLLEDLPTSTEQLLHTRAFFPDRDPPTDVIIPALRGVTKEYENTMGEFGVRLFLYQHSRRTESALLGAMGWDGDRYVLFRAGESTGIIWVSVWDSRLEAAEFRGQVATHLDANLYMATEQPIPGASRLGTIDGVQYRSRGRLYYLGAAEISGRPAVIYVDAPEGFSTDVIDVRQLRVVEQPR